MELLEIFPWGTTRSHLETILAGQFTPHPTQNAIGLQGNLYGSTSFTVLYFITVGGEARLSRLNVTYDTDELDDSSIERIYRDFQNDIVESYGQPKRTSGFDKTAPKEFRISEMLQWETSTTVIALTKKLTKDGFRGEEAGVGFIASDRMNDPVARMI